MVKVKGIDVSHWERMIDWSKLKSDGIGFVFLKATDGTSYKDSSFDRRWLTAKTVGITRGAYHYFRPEYDPNLQATHFFNAVGPLTDFDLPPVMDWEAMDNQPSGLVLARGLAFLEAVERAFGRLPIIYGGPAFLAALNLPVEVSRYPLWIAHYDVAEPRIPKPFQGWNIWQTTDKGKIEGIGVSNADSCDVNLFNGDSQALAEFISQSKVKVTQTH